MKMLNNPLYNYEKSLGHYYSNVLVSTKDVRPKSIFCWISKPSRYKIFVVDYENQADLKVYKVKYQIQDDKNEGRWFFTDYSNQSDKKILRPIYQLSRLENLLCKIWKPSGLK
jgi:hypothetical protein